MPSQFGGGFVPGLRVEKDVLDESFDFLASEHYILKRGGVTLDAALVTANANGDRILRGGTLLGKVTASARYGPYAARTNEVQSVAVTGGPTAGTFTLALSGQPTAPLPLNTTAAQLQAALEALSNVNSGDVAVSGGPLPGAPLVVTFLGRYLGTDVALMTRTHSLTGGVTPDVTITTTTAGGAAIGAGADGREAPKGVLFAGDLNLRHGPLMLIGMLIHGSVLEARTPGVDEAAKTALAGRVIFQ